VEQVMRIRGQAVPASPALALPVITFREEVGFHMNGVRVQVQHVAAAHTDGDAILWFEGRDAVHMGDTYFNGMYPFIDVDSGGGVNGMIDAVNGVLARASDATRIIPGHGPLSRREELETYRDMLVAVRDRVSQGLAQGRSIDEIVAGKPTADLDATWGGGFMKADDFLRLVAAGLR
jgi:glyoxylase-like metal-dependent hydrolase (beta-lactamase superfamily II)